MGGFKNRISSPISCATPSGFQGTLMPCAYPSLIQRCVRSCWAPVWAKGLGLLITSVITCTHTVSATLSVRHPSGATWAPAPEHCSLSGCPCLPPAQGSDTSHQVPAPITHPRPQRSPRAPGRSQSQNQVGRDSEFIESNLWANTTMSTRQHRVVFA